MTDKTEGPKDEFPKHFWKWFTAYFTIAFLVFGVTFHEKTKAEDFRPGMPSALAGVGWPVYYIGKFALVITDPDLKICWACPK